MPIIIKSDCWHFSFITFTQLIKPRLLNALQKIPFSKHYPIHGNLINLIQQ
jgi:hypothetical protein